MLAGAVAMQSLKPVPRRDCKFRQGADTVKLVELAAHNWPQWFWARRACRLRVSAIENIFGSAIRERTYHGSDYNDLRYKWLVAELVVSRVLKRSCALSLPTPQHQEQGYTGDCAVDKAEHDTE